MPKTNEQHILIRIISISIEIIYSSWDIKVVADELWKEADRELRRAIKAQWEENAKALGQNDFMPPDWCIIDGDGIKIPPFKWNDVRRAILRAELDAIYAKLYNLTEKELRYILNPQDVYGEGFPGETFRVLKDKEIKKFGEYRTKRFVLEARERLNNKLLN